MIAATPLERSIVRGGKVTFVVSLRSINGFRGDVTMFARILPGDALWEGSSWSRQPVTLAPGATATSTLIIVTNNATRRGAQPITVEARAGDIQDSANLVLTVR